MDRKASKLKKNYQIKSGTNRYNQTPLFQDTQSTFSGIFSFDQHQGMGDGHREKLGDLSKASVASRHTQAAQLTSFGRILE